MGSYDFTTGTGLPDKTAARREQESALEQRIALDYAYMHIMKREFRKLKTILDLSNLHQDKALEECRKLVESAVGEIDSFYLLAVNKPFYDSVQIQDSAAIKLGWIEKYIITTKPLTQSYRFTELGHYHINQFRRTIGKPTIEEVISELNK